GELNHRIQCDRRSVLEWIAYRVADYRCVVERRAFLFQLDLDDLFCVVPGSAGVSHEDGLIEAEDGDGNQVADEEERLDEAEGQRGKKYRDENIQHALLRIERANLDHFFAVCDGGPVCAFELDIGFDEFAGAIGPGGDGLRGSAGEPINHGAAGDEAEEKRGVQKRKLVHIFGDAMREGHDDGENHGGCADHCRADQNRLSGSLKGVPGAVVGFQQILGATEIHVHVEVFFELLLDVGNLLDQGKFIDGLRVVRHRAVGIDCDCDRAHAQKPESHQTERKNRRGDHQVAEATEAYQIPD